MGAHLGLTEPLLVAAAAVLALGALAGCGDASDVAACRQSCGSLGLVSDGQPCETMCSGDCEELAETYGVDVATCERLQAGEL